MMRAFTIAAFTLAVSFFVPGQPARQNNGDTSKAVMRVMKLESRWVRAVMRRDAKALGRILADDYVGTSSSGEARNKAQTMADFKSAALSFSSMELDDFDVRVYGDQCVVSGRATVKVNI